MAQDRAASDSVAKAKTPTRKTQTGNHRPDAALTAGAPGAAASAEEKTGESLWRVRDKTDRSCEAFLLGSLADVASGRLGPKDFRPVSPPDLAAALGLATVYRADTAGWFLSAGRRLLVRSADGSAAGPVYSYESLARLGWAVGVARGKPPGARIFWSCGSDDEPLEMNELLKRAIGEAANADVWIVAGQAEFSIARGESLLNSPARGGAKPSDADDASDNASDASRPRRLSVVRAEEREAPGLIVALVVAGKDGSRAARELRSRCFPENAEATGEFLIRAHFALFKRPGPAINPDRSFQSIWKVPREEIPEVATVCEALPGTRIRRANLSVWRVASVVPYNLYEDPDLVDVIALDPTIGADQRLAGKDNPFGVALYPRPRFVLREPVAEAIVRVNARLRGQGYRLKLYDAYRPLSVTQRLWHMYQRMEASNDPQHRYLAVPNIGSRHNRGAAVDCTLTDMEGRELEMPSEYLTFDERSNLRWSKMSEKARRHLGVLTKAMEAEGFTTIREEWWHFDAPNWPEYRVADVPFWPEPGEEDTIQARTNRLLAARKENPPTPGH